MYNRSPIRPSAHFAPIGGSMNDPNGLIYFEDKWHLFYQYQPVDTGEEKHWGHAVSHDLLNWEHLPIALFPDEHGAIWSGSCVLDANDSSGFFGGRPGLVAVFTHRTPFRQAQSLAYSVDGRVWHKYAGNPVLHGGQEDFRDPKVFWHSETAAWIMIVSAGNRIELYRSTDLRVWTFASAFGQGLAPGLVWECPDLFFLHDEHGAKIWILTASFLDGVNFQGGFGACFAAFLQGLFDGTTFTPGQPTFQRLSFGPDDYAPTTFNESPGGRRIVLGWLDHWGYALHLGTGESQGQMTIPRELTWRDGRLLQSLPVEIEAARWWQRHEMFLERAVEIGADLFEVRISPHPFSWQLNATKGNVPIFRFAWNARRQTWYLQRHPASLPPVRAPKPEIEPFFIQPWIGSSTGPSAGQAHLVIDINSVEIFCDDGAVLFCARLSPPGGRWKLSLQAGAFA